MPPRKASASARAGSSKVDEGVPTRRSTRSASGSTSTRSASGTTTTKRATAIKSASRKRDVDPESSEGEGSNGRIGDATQTLRVAETSDHEHVDASVEMSRQRPAGAKQTKTRVASRSRAASGRKGLTASSQTSHGQPPVDDNEADTDSAISDADDNVLSKGPTKATLRRSTSGPDVVAPVAAHDGKVTAEHHVRASPDRSQHPDRTTHIADDLEDSDESSSLDADATFVAPTKPSRPSIEPGLTTPAQKHARFSLLSPTMASAPSTPSNKSDPTAPGTVTSTPGLPAQPSTRLVIHKLVLKDFKSYAGTQTIGPFHKSFSSVVGPNGSGKSNVIDSLLFVFGWRANKMRQGKLSELIHSSSIAGRPKPSETQVSVVFREIEDLPGPDAYRVVPKSKLVVSRTAYQNNTSVYHLNGKRSSFTEVTTLLRGRGIDLDHKRFLILQGEVESIAQMPPKARNEHEEGLLEYLEDIIGTSRFKEEIEAAGKTVDECNEQRGERLGRLRIVQREKDAMEGKKKEAETLLRDQNTLTRHQSRLWQLYQWECRQVLEDAGNAIAELNVRITLEREKHEGAQASVADLEAKYSSAKSEWDVLRKDVEKLSKAVEKSEKDDLQLGEKRKHLETKRKKLQKTANDEKHQLSEARSTLSSSDDDIERLRAEVQKLEASLETEEATLDSIRDSLKSKTGHLTQQIEAKQRDLAPWADKVKEKEGLRNVKQQEVELIQGREEARAKTMSEARETRQRLKDEVQAKQRELRDLTTEREQVGTTTAESSKALQQARADEAELRNKLSLARAKADEAKSAQQASASQSSVLTSLARQADLGMIKGFHGRLGSLGVIDDKYDVAISTACPGLDSIVVDTVECGQACIEHLRKNNLGRANFILLDSISKGPIPSIETPENVPRLLDLVKSREPRFVAAFYHQLRDTLVARDLSHANRIAYGARRWRVVTLDGQLIDKSGTMSGGGTRVARGGMSSKFADADYTPEQIARLQQTVTTLDGELQGLTLKLQRMDLEHRDLSARPAQLEIEIEKVQMAIKVGTQRLEEAHRRIQELKAESKPDAADASRLDQLVAEIEELDSAIAELQLKTSAFEAEIAALHEKVLAAGGVGLQTQQSKVEGMREMIDLSGEKLTKAEVAKSKAEKDISKYETSTAKREKVFADLEEEIASAQTSAAEITDVVSRMRKSLEDQQHALEGKQEEKDELKQSLDESSSTINAFRSLELEIKQKLEDNQRTVGETQKKARHWEEKLSHLELHVLDADDEDAEGDNAGETAAPQEDRSRGELNPDGHGQDSLPASVNVKQEADGDVTTPSDAPDQSQETSEAVPKQSEKSDETLLRTYTDDELSVMRKDDIKADIADCEERISKGSGNLAVLVEYRKREQEFLARARDLEQTTQERDAAKTQYDVLRKQRLDEFMAGFGTISSKLKEMYQTITLGGNAELELVDSLDPFSEGILFSVMPPKKSWKNISNLSGGEKTLSSLALVFALHAFKPTPLYVMDEIDAALDFRNVSIVANLIKERTKNAQFVIISLRNNMFELASRLVGIYKTNGQTKSLAVENTELSQAMAEEAAIASATLMASARKAKTHPAPPRTPSSTVAHAQRLQASLARQSQLSAARGLGAHGGESSLPATPSGPLRRTQMAAPDSSISSLPMSMSVPSMAAAQASHGLPKTPFAIPQTPRMPKSILARTPRVPSATPRVPSNASQRTGRSSSSSSSSATVAGVL
ncbi:unnamed protein product [Parajaminaea phylloscopi]